MTSSEPSTVMLSTNWSGNDEDRSVSLFIALPRSRVVVGLTRKGKDELGDWDVPAYC